MTATARPSAIGAPAYSQSYLREKESAALVRKMVRTVLETWHLPNLADGAEHVVSELVANAVDHARGRCFRLVVTRTSDDRVRVSVIDRSHDKPERKTPSPSEERGRGLAVVDAFSASWGVDQLPWGKRVWAELEADQ
ncbi:ATP-binding protein [Streptomyces sp. NEAU-YJ-81]|uniref:ATP-binding protein n=1 Tax=Streptomyces sp. NEAU-YJ-81 TaxID=2820288 RepID=UPI001ABBE5F1|nr:ATP-binding protein [Streptomyces sp. NEAU-YJ-81]MBO3682718.1 ATP-binding protein [Streptomyces sp. NEAU-YJ-81]